MLVFICLKVEESNVLVEVEVSILGGFGVGFWYFWRFWHLRRFRCVLVEMLVVCFVFLVGIVRFGSFLLGSGWFLGWWGILNW